MADERFLDLDDESRRALELDGVLAGVAAHAVTGRGADELRASRPLARAAELRAALDAVDEARAFLEREGRLLPARLPDPFPALDALAIEDYAVEATALRDLAVALVAAADLRHRLASEAVARGPHLSRLAAEIPDLRSLARPIVAHIGPDGRLLDGASDELARIRTAIARTGDRLRRQLESFVNDPSAAAVVRDDFVTQRNGRYVIPVRADSPRPVPGIVHAASSSGVTLFVEPLSSVELNNELVRLAEQEQSEQERILKRWAGRLRERAGEIETACDGLVAADRLQARALYADETGSVRPDVGEDGPLDLREARHPILERHLIEEGRRCVPLSLELGADDRVLLLSGPNTGGKTVALKTVGLIALMSHCGLHVPARQARLPVFRQLRADIGDHQSIESDLSTFSAHVRAVAGWIDGAAPPALFLFDEIGTGTEPTEGAALAQAVLEKLMDLGVLAVATTHQNALKAWAFTTQGAASAALEFDEADLKPTYRILMGAAGTSAGIDIASRLGLDSALVGRARDLLGAGSRQIEASMARLRELTVGLEARHADLARAKKEIDDALTEADQSAARDRERIRSEVNRALETVVAEFRARARSELAAVEDRRERARLERELGKAEGRLAAARAALTRRIAPTRPPEVDERPFEPSPGRAVRIVSLDRDGIVEAVREDKVEVRMGTTTFTVRRSDLAPPTGATPSPKASRIRDRHPSSWAVGADDDLAPAECNLIGKRVDEAIPELDKFIDRAARTGRGEVRVVHGHGTGRLRQAARRFLREHPLVDSQRPGSQEEGGDGVTIVRLR